MTHLAPTLIASWSRAQTLRIACAEGARQDVSASCTYVVHGASDVALCALGLSDYLMEGTTCTLCPSVAGCETFTTCNATGGNPQCTACGEGYYLSGGTCAPCEPVAGCQSALTCPQGASVCTSCVSGTYLSATGAECLECASVDFCTVNETCTSATDSVRRCLFVFVDCRSLSGMCTGVRSLRTGSQETATDPCCRHVSSV